jgi:hypothetical protein
MELFAANVRVGSLNETARAVERCAQGSGWGWRDRGTGLAVLSEDRGVNNLGSDRSIP